MPVSTIGIVGAGVMGRSIAQVYMFVNFGA